MYDMPDDQIIGFWGKRSFIGKGIPRPKNYIEAAPLQLPDLASTTETVGEPAAPEPETPPEPEPPTSWRNDPQLFRHWQPLQAVYATEEPS